MYAQCPVCQFHYEPEVGFYWGAMYYSYAFSVIIVVIAGISLYYLANDLLAWVYMVTVTATVIMLTPVLFRYARAMMLFLFGGTGFDRRYTS